MADYRPMIRKAYCTEDHWRAVVEAVDEVKDAGDKNHLQVEAEVDLHDASHPQIRLAGNSEPIAVDSKFVDTFRALPAATTTPDEQKAICDSSLAEAPKGPEPISPFFIAIPPPGLLLQYLIDRFGRHDLNRITTDFGKLGLATNAFYIGGQALFVASYIPIHRRLEETAAWATDGFCLGGSLGFGIAAAAQSPGNGTPELSASLTLASTCIPAIIYGSNGESSDPVRFWLGFGSQVALGGIFVGLGFGGVGRRPAVTGNDIYAPSDLAPGTREATGNPYESTRFPGLSSDMAILGILQGSGALINAIDYAVSGSTAEETPVQVSPLPLPGKGAGLSIAGRL